MDFDEFQDTVDRVSYPDREFRCSYLGVWGFGVNVVYSEPDVLTGKVELQKGRLWYLPMNTSPDQVFQTCLKAVLTSHEHQVREHFTVDDYPIYGPHLSAETLITLFKES